ncbi:MAG: hypothetical protein ACREP7_05540 [Lysobacter sp.]
MANTDDTVATLSNGLPLPPVPQRLRDMLKDYPEHINRLQNALNFAVERPAGSPPFEIAVWALEDQIGGFIREAQTELESVESGGDAEKIAQANAKELLMFQARSGGMKGLHELWDYFQTHKNAFR